MNDEILNDIADNLQQYVWNKVQLYMLANKEALCDIKLGNRPRKSKAISQLIDEMVKDLVIDEWKYGGYFNAFVDVKDIGIGERKGYKCGQIYIDEFKETEGGFYRYGEHKIRNHCKIQGSPAENARHYQRAPIQTEF